jgi:hypothetical protein
MTLIHILIDLENVKPTAADFDLVREPQYRLWLFRGPHQNKFDAEIMEVLQPLGDRVKHVRSAKSGKNALDFLITFTLGRLVQEGKTAAAPTGKALRFVIVSKDSGFDALLGHVQESGYDAVRAGTIREALVPGGEKDTVAAALPRAKEAASGMAGTIVGKPTPSKAPPAKAATKVATPAPKKAAKADSWVRLLDHLRDHPQNRPTTSAALERHLKTLLGKETSEIAVKELMARLQKQGVAVLKEGKIEYKIPDKKK